MGFPTEPLPAAEGIDRRSLLKCMAWVGTGLVWTVAGGLPSARLFGQAGRDARKGTFSFVQISDSHIGFGKDPYKQTVVATLQEAVARINALPQRPDFLIHTGDQLVQSAPLVGQPARQRPHGPTPPGGEPGTGDPDRQR